MLDVIDSCSSACAACTLQAGLASSSHAAIPPWCSYRAAGKLLVLAGPPSCRPTSPSMALEKNHAPQSALVSAAAKLPLTKCSTPNGLKRAMVVRLLANLVRPGAPSFFLSLPPTHASPQQTEHRGTNRQLPRGDNFFAGCLVI